MGALQRKEVFWDLLNHRCAHVQNVRLQLVTSITVFEAVADS